MLVLQHACQSQSGEEAQRIDQENREFLVNSRHVRENREAWHRHPPSGSGVDLGSGVLIPMIVISDSDLIPVTHSDAMSITVGAKRR